MLNLFQLLEVNKIIFILYFVIILCNKTYLCVINCVNKQENMTAFIKEYWWKLLCVTLFVYVLSTGLLKPLGSGIETVDTSAATVGTPLTLGVRCYNSQLTTAKPRAWLKVGDSCFVVADTVTVRDDRNLTLQFALSGNFPVKD